MASHGASSRRREDLAGRQVEIAAARVTFAGVRSAVWIRGFIAGPREARPDVRLVRRLVLREAHVAVDPERRFRRVRPERDPTSPELVVDRDAERLERAPSGKSVEFGLARLDQARSLWRRARRGIDGLRAGSR